jgi:2-succinyl-5-enolpyruvyl-6-hydroxy-3-cyclohexene-1-carboxylate synthase
VSAPANFNALWARALADELFRGGVRDAAICPGSRSGPLALACAERLRAHIVIDERSGAFFALGAARAAGRPAVVLATSGSAGAHFYPAILEAEAAGVPLIALTADRPPELHGFGAPQTLDQQRLFGGHVRFFADLGVPEPLALPHLRATVARALQQAGPAHLNAPFREPLAPVPEPLPEVRDVPAARHLLARGVPDLREVAAELLRRPRGVIVCGPRDAQDELPAAVRELSHALGYPVIADAASQVRFALPDAVAHADLILRSEPWARALRPDAVIRIGGGVSSKLLQAYVEEASYTLVLHERGPLIDPAHTASVSIEGNTPAICRALSSAAGPRAAASGIAELYAEAEARARAALESAFADAPWGEPLIAREAALAAAQLYVSSSMPVRDLDAFAARGGRVLANRGVNGIDGIVSSAAGAAAATGTRTLALVGDLALLHDLSGLVAAARLRIPLTVLAVNNDGGGIFHFLPIALHAERFEELFATPHGLDLEGAAQLCGAEFARVTDARSLRAALQAPPALRLIEARVDRSRNLEQHRAMQAAVIAGLGEPEACGSPP